MDNLLNLNKHIILHSNDKAQREDWYKSVIGHFTKNNIKYYDIGHVNEHADYIDKIEDIFPLTDGSYPGVCLTYNVINDIQLDWVAFHDNVFVVWPDTLTWDEKEWFYQTISCYLTQKVLINEFNENERKLKNKKFVLILISDDSINEYFENAKVYYGYRDQTKAVEDFVNENFLVVNNLESF